MKRTLILLVVIATSITSCKKEEIDSVSTANENALQGSWVQDSSWTYNVNKDITPFDTTIISQDYTQQNFVVEGNIWANTTSNWSQQLSIYDDYIEIGGTNYRIDLLTANQFVLTRIPQESFTEYYTRWFSR